MTQHKLVCLISFNKALQHNIYLGFLKALLETNIQQFGFVNIHESLLHILQKIVNYPISQIWCAEAEKFLKHSG